MSIWDGIKSFLAIEPMQPLQERTVDPFTVAPTLATQFAAIRNTQAQARPWRLPSISEALGFPAILRAVTLISNTTGSLAIQGWRDEMPMAETPRIITRPDPFRTPQESYRDMAWAMATRGETILWIAARDYNDQPLTLIVVPLEEVTVEENTRNRLFPIYTWGNVKSTRFSPANPSGAFVHITYAKLSPLDLRGVGPLQMCGAAISVSVEAQEWAANFYAEGGRGGTIIKTAQEINEIEAGKLKAQWIATPNNVPRVIDPLIEDVKEMDINPQGAQMMQARDYQNGDAARMFGIPGSLLDYSTPGSSLTYQNLEGEFGKFLRACLAPNYLAPIEQSLTDLLPRSVVARFYVDGLLRADIKTRFDVYASGITSGVMTVDEARTKEGLAPGNIEVSATPAAAPQAIPASIPMQERSAEIRCDGMTNKRRLGVSVLEPCHRLLSTTGSFVGTCPRCKKAYTAPVLEVRSELSETLDALRAFATREQPAPVFNVTAPVTITMPEPVTHARSVAPSESVTRLVYDDAGRIVSVIEDAS